MAEELKDKFKVLGMIRGKRWNNSKRNGAALAIAGWRMCGELFAPANSTKTKRHLL